MPQFRSETATNIWVAGVEIEAEAEFRDNCTL